jgi:hypothetical protein
MEGFRLLSTGNLPFDHTALFFTVIHKVFHHLVGRAFSLIRVLLDHFIIFILLNDRFAGSRLLLAENFRDHPVFLSRWK